MRLFVVAAALTLFAITATAEDIYVDNLKGDDRNSGRVQRPGIGRNGPVRTISRALRSSHKGDRIVFAKTGVPYSGSFTLQGGKNSGFLTRPFVIEGNGQTLDGTAPIPFDAWVHFSGDVHCFTPVYKSYQQLYREGKPVTYAETSSRDEVRSLKPLSWTLFEGNIFFCTEKDNLPANYLLSFSARRTGITLYEVRNVVIRDLTVQGFQLDGINVHSNSSEVEILAVTSRGNGRSGISVGGASRVNIAGSLLGDNGKVQLRADGFSKTSVVESTLLENTAPAMHFKDAKIEIDGEQAEVKPASI